jgi:hypothetical protein
MVGKPAISEFMEAIRGQQIERFDGKLGLQTCDPRRTMLHVPEGRALDDVEAQ